MVNPAPPTPYRRILGDHIKDLLAQKTMVVVIGPARVGKTRMLRDAFPDLPYVSLAAGGWGGQDSLGRSIQNGAIIDDIHENPETAVWIRGLVRKRELKGPILLCGNHLGPAIQGHYFPYRHNSGVGKDGEKALLTLLRESADLAVATLLPCTLAEYGAVGHDKECLREVLITGGYPEALKQECDASGWYGDLIESWVQDQHGSLIKSYQLVQLRDFLYFCAEQTGQPLNMSKMARALGNSQPTVRRWVRALLRDHLAYLLPASRQGGGHRLIKGPKLFFSDTGILCRLLGIVKSSQLERHRMEERIFESWVVSEVRTYSVNQGLRGNIGYWQDRHGNGVAMLVEGNRTQFVLDVRHRGVLQSRRQDGIRWWLRQRVPGEWTGMLISDGRGGAIDDRFRQIAWHRLPRSPAGWDLDAPELRISPRWAAWCRRRRA